MTITPRPLPTIASQIAQSRVTIGQLNAVAAAVTAGYLSQNQVNTIVANAIASLRQGE